METLFICLTVIIVFAMLSYVAYHFINKIGFNNEKVKQVDDLLAKVTKLTERVSAVEMGRMR